MKKGILLIAILFAAVFGSVQHTQAQVSFGVNIGTQPQWGPTGYDYAQYYYIPDIDAYYDVNSQTYVYLDNGSWVSSTYLPPAYANFDLYRAHKVVINADRPWLRHDYYRDHYAYFRGRHDQAIIRDSRDMRYRQNRGFERRNEWGGWRRHDNGWHGRGHEMHEREEHEHGRR